MKLLPEKDYHELFRLSILLKTIDGVLEILAGFALFFIKYTPISDILFSIFRQEITETPRDFFWGSLIKEWHKLFDSGGFWGFLFLAHGITKVLLSIALLKEKLWAYPLAAGVFTIFVAYEIYSLFTIPSLFLGLITLFDIIVVVLILHEYRRERKKRSPHHAK